MSFASQEGSSIGQSIEFLFSDNDSLLINSSSEAMSQPVPVGTFVFSCNFDMYSLPTTSTLTMGCKATITYNDKVVAQYRINGQEYDHICLTGFIFSDGHSTLNLEISANNYEKETALLWGYSAGTLQLVRLNNI